MALDAAHRASIYEKLRPVLGDEDANVLMSEFPSIEAQELVTKDFLRAELAGIEAKLAGFDAQLAALEGRLTVRIGSAIAASTGLMVAAIALLG